AEYGERDPRAYPLHALQGPEPGALMLGGEAEQPDLVLAHVRVDGKGHGLSNRRQAGQRAGADCHLVANAADIDAHRVEREGVAPAVELANHGRALCPTATASSSLRRTREWACVMAMASASAASALSGAARGRRHFTMALICTLSPCPAPITVFFTAFG